MKNIFIVTDFSEASRNAARYGIELAGFFNANVFLFHAYQAPIHIPESYIFYTTEDVWESSKELLEKEATIINPKNLVNIEICGGEGKAADAIIAEAKRKKADVIICGMKDMAKPLRKIFGSTTSSLTKKSEIPLIVVPETARFRLPEKIALACDIDPQTSASTIVLLKEIGEKFSTKLSVVWVVDEGFNTTESRKFNASTFIDQLKSMNPVFKFPTGVNITKALDNFVNEHAIDMLAMIPHKHDFLERFFSESITREMIFQTEIPLLVLPQLKNGEIGNE